MRWREYMYLTNVKRPNGKHQISISKGIRDPQTKKNKRIQVKCYGTYDLNTKEGKRILDLAESELKEMNKLEEASKGFATFEDFIESTRRNGLSLKNRNIGYLPYYSIFKELKLPNFFKKLTKDSKLEYDYDRFYVSTLKSTIKALINIGSFEILLSPIG